MIKDSVPFGELQPVAQFETLDDAQEYALVVLAMRVDCLITVNDDEDYILHVEPAFVLAVQDEFVAYAAEQQEMAALLAQPDQLFSDTGFEAGLVWICVLLSVFIFQLRDPSITGRFLNSAQPVLSGGEWYRPFTALFLHADFEHLLGNAFSGLLFGWLLGSFCGAWRAWPLIIAAGFLGNVFSVLLHWGEVYRSLGASTATFGAVGLLSVFGVWGMLNRDRGRRTLMTMMVPLIAGATLLAQFGTAGDNTDVVGHLMGFLAGGLLAVPFAFLKYRRERELAS